MTALSAMRPTARTPVGPRKLSKATIFCPTIAMRDVNLALISPETDVTLASVAAPAAAVAVPIDEIGRMTEATHLAAESARSAAFTARNALMPL